MVEEQVGRITHYFSKVGVAVINIESGELVVGDVIHIKGATTDFEQRVDSMQIEHEGVGKATAGQSIGLKAADVVREQDLVFKVVEG